MNGSLFICLKPRRPDNGHVSTLPSKTGTMFFELNLR